MMLMTLMLPYQVTLIPQYVLFRELGWVNTILPLVVPKFLAVDAFFIFLMVQFFRGIPRELDEAAHDGRLLALAHLLEDHAAALACRCWRRPRSSPSSGPGTISSPRSST